MSILDATLVHLKAGMKIPDVYLNEVFKVRRSGIGYALHEGKDVSITLERGATDTDKPFDAKDIEAICDAAPKSDIVFWFFSGPAKYHMEDIQPFVILGDENNQQAVGFSAGDFPNYIPSGSDHSNDYFLWNKFLIPKLHKISKTDCNAIFNELNDPITKQEIENTAGSGTIVLLSGTGRVDWFGGRTGVYEWGMVSDNHGYKEEPARQKGAMLARAAAGVKAMIGPHTEVEIPVKQIAVAETSVTAVEDNVEFEYFTPDDNMRKMSNKALKNIYKGICGYVPKNYKEFPTVRYPKRKPQLKAAKPPQVVAKSFDELPKDQIVTAAAVAVDKSVTTKTLPVMAPKLVQSVQADFLDNQSQAIPIPPDKLQDLESKFATFWEATKIKELTTDAWDWEAHLSLAMKYPVACAILCWNYKIHKLMLQNQLQYSEQEEDQVDTSGTGIVKPEPAAETAPQSEPETVVLAPASTPAAAPAVAPAAGGGMQILGRRRKAM